MTRKQAVLLRDAIALPPKVRATLAEQLLDSLTPGGQAENDAAWAEEAERRLGDYEDGKAAPVPAADVFRRLLRKGQRR
jgi:putative addiction module component (TIGR02574 family)